MPPQNLPWHNYSKLMRYMSTSLKENPKNTNWALILVNTITVIFYNSSKKKITMN